MQIQILSDLHLEFAELENPQASDAQLVVLAGDISEGIKGVAWALETFSVPVVYVMGNHEFYHHQRDALIAEIRTMTAGSHVHLLERDSVEVNGVRFLGTTLWTDFELYGTPKESAEVGADRVPDFHVIKESKEYKESEGRLFTPQDGMAEHHRSLAWLKEELAGTSNESTVVITHHAPSRLSIAEKFANDSLNPCFVSDLESFIQDHDIPLWIHGHMHTRFDYQLHGTRVVCNPRGYQPYETDTGFDSSFCVSL